MKNIHKMNNIIDFNDILVAGGFIFAALYGTKNHYEIVDIDIFMYNNNDIEKKLINNIQSIYIKDYKEASYYDIPIIRSKNAVTINSKYQFILRDYKTISEILHGFDVDSCCMGYDGKDIWMTKRCLLALMTGRNVINFDRLSPTYIDRLVKYSYRGVAVYDPNLNVAKIDRDKLKFLIDNRKCYLKRAFDTYLRVKNDKDAIKSISKWRAGAGFDDTYKIILWIYRRYNANNSTRTWIEKYDPEHKIFDVNGIERRQTISLRSKQLKKGYRNETGLSKLLLADMFMASNIDLFDKISTDIDSDYGKVNNGLNIYHVWGLIDYYIPHKQNEDKEKVAINFRIKNMIRPLYIKKSKYDIHDYDSDDDTSNRNNMNKYKKQESLPPNRVSVMATMSYYDSFIIPHHRADKTWYIGLNLVGKNIDTILNDIFHIPDELYDTLSKLRELDIPKNITFKVTNPGEQMTNTFNKTVLKDPSKWYESIYYNSNNEKTGKN